MAITLSSNASLASHLTFLALLTAWVVNSRDSELSYAFVQLVRESILGSEMLAADTEVYSEFADVSSMAGTTQFIRGPLLDALYGGQASGAVGPFEAAWINSQAQLLGAPRMRQIRVATNSCEVSQMASVVPTCYPSLWDGRRRKAPIYGENLGGGVRRVYRYVDGSYTELPFVARINSYMPGGYVVDLPSRRLHASAILDQMERDRFVSIETRALFIDFTVYNVNINTFCVVRIVFEHLESGGVLAYAMFRTARLLPYAGDWGNLQFSLDAMVITCVAVLLAARLANIHNEARSKKGFRWRAHFMQLWVFVDWLVITCFWVVLATRYYVRSAMAELAAEAPFDNDKHYPLFNATMANLVETNLLAVVALVVYLKTFKYLRDFPIVHRLLNTIAASQKDMAAFVGVFAIVMMAFSLAFHLGFGLDVQEFRGVGTAFLTLMRFVLGDADVQKLLAVNSILALLLCGLFTFLVYLQLIAIAVAVLLKAYASQPSDRKAALAVLDYALARRDRLLKHGLSDLGQAMAALRLVALRQRVARAEVQHGCGGVLDADASARRQERERRMKTSSLSAAVGVNAVGGGENGWVAAGELRSDQYVDPMREAELVFGAAAASADAKSVHETYNATRVLKALYLEVSDARVAHLSEIEQVQMVVRALRDENFALSAALTEKGVALDAAQDVTAASVHTTVHSDAEGACGNRPPPGAAKAAALISLASRSSCHARSSQINWQPRLADAAGREHDRPGRVRHT